MKKPYIFLVFLQIFSSNQKLFPELHVIQLLQEEIWNMLAILWQMIQIQDFFLKHSLKCNKCHKWHFKFKPKWQKWHLVDGGLAVAVRSFHLWSFLPIQTITFIRWTALGRRQPYKFSTVSRVFDFFFNLLRYQGGRFFIFSSAR